MGVSACFYSALQAVPEVRLQETSKKGEYFNKWLNKKVFVRKLLFLTSSEIQFKNILIKQASLEKQLLLAPWGKDKKYQIHNHHAYQVYN